MPRTARRIVPLLAPLTALVTALLGAFGCSPRPADLVLRGGVVCTMDADRPAARAVAVRGGRIVFVGDDEAAAAWIGARTEIVELDGRMVLPGFHDSHTHPVLGGVELGECVLSGLATADAVLRTIAEYAAAHPDAPWLLGNGWELPVFADASPRREMLDAIAPDRPAFMLAADGHSAWVNSAALERAGVDARTPDPPGGRIERDPATGAPTGTLREEAIELVQRHVPPYDHDDHVAGLRRALRLAARFGITSLQEANASAELMDAYLDLDRRGELTARVSAALEIDAAEGVAALPRLRAMRRHYRGRMLRADAVKIFVDGVIESRTAALLAPYLGGDGERGPLLVEAAPLAELITALDGDGFQVHVHAIGDRATRVTLDAFEAARAANGRRDGRHHIAHLQLVDPRDVPRFAALGVVANFQPLWAYPDTYITELTIPVLGEERSRRIYPIGDVAATGAVVAFGSDWSVSSMNPIEGMQVAVTRRDPAAGAGPAWLPEQRVDLQQALRAYTVSGAYLAFAEDRSGTITPGKEADLVVLDRDLHVLPADRLHEARVLLTLLEGRAVFRDPSFATAGP